LCIQRRPPGRRRVCRVCQKLLDRNSLPLGGRLARAGHLNPVCMALDCGTRERERDDGGGCETSHRFCLSSVGAGLDGPTL
jgi:hypothetical protein